MEDVRSALAAKGYDIVQQEGADSDSEEDPIPGRIKSIEPSIAKEKGNKAFQEGKYDKAIKLWQGGLKNILSSLCAGPHALQDKNLSEYDLTLNLNIAMAYMKKGDFDAADRSVDKALARRDALPPNLVVKALYRKASCQRSMHKLEECLETLKDILQVEPGHSASLQVQQEVQREWNSQIRDQKKNFKKAWSKLEGEDKAAKSKEIERRREVRANCGIVWTPNDVDSEAFEQGNAPQADGTTNWGLAFSRTCLWSLEQLALEADWSLSPSEAGASAWFLGCSSTCELRLMQPIGMMQRMPGLQALELVLVGFLGELDPDGKREHDPKAETLPKGLIQSSLADGRKVSLMTIKGTLQEALEKELALPAKQAAEDTFAASSASDAAADATGAAAGAGAAASGAATASAADAASNVEGGPSASGGAPARAETATHGDEATAPLLPQVPPSMCFIAHPQLHRYFTEFFPALTWLIENKVPTIIIGASEPDHSWRQDEVLLKAAGCNVVVGKRESPYPMALVDAPNVRKCNHIIGFWGGKPVPRDKLTSVKLDLLAQDYQVR